MNDYRHRGRRPRTKEMAIVMMCDSVESASRGEFQIDDPTPEKIAALVDRVIAEKVNDGQLSESELTLGDLSKVRRALVESLIGHYHQRIPYPNFPGVANRPLPKLPEPGRD
jgi:membrane-associated HD superfamily phosphohydrolase